MAEVPFFRTQDDQLVYDGEFVTLRIQHGSTVRELTGWNRYVEHIERIHDDDTSLCRTIKTPAFELDVEPFDVPPEYGSVTQYVITRVLPDPTPPTTE